MESKPMFRVSLRAQGIKKRCRKVDNHYFKMGYEGPELEPEDVQKLHDKAYEMLNTTMREVKKASLCLDYVEIRGDMETWKPFDEITKENSVKYKLEVGQ